MFSSVLSSLNTVVVFDYIRVCITVSHPSLPPSLPTSVPPSPSLPLPSLPFPLPPSLPPLPPPPSPPSPSPPLPSLDRKLKFQPYIVDVWSIAVFTANFVTVRGVLAPLFRIECCHLRIEYRSLLIRIRIRIVRKMASLDELWPLNGSTMW